MERLKQELQTLKETLKQTRQALLAEKAKALPRPPATSASLRMAWTEPVSGSWPTRAWNGAGASARSSPARTRPGTATPWAAKPWTSGPRPKASSQAGGKGRRPATLIQGAVTASRQEILAYFR